MKLYGRWSSALRSTALCAGVVLACGIVAGLGVVLAGDESGYLDRRLVDVLGELQDGGLDLIFSSAVVDENLRVNVEPTPTEPRAMLEEMLEPLGLKAEDGPGGSILILPADPLGKGFLLR